jgi:hypothetical protein
MRHPLEAVVADEGGNMSLLIACLLIYNFHMDPWRYAIVSVLWAIKYTPAIWKLIEG